MTLLVAIPAYGGTVTIGCMLSVLGLLPALMRRKISVQIKTVDYPDVAAARNELAAHFLDDPSCSSLLFIDNDMTFSPETILKMIDADKEVIGCACPKKQIDLSRIMELAKHHPPSTAIARASVHNVRKNWKDARVINGLCEVDSVGTAIFLIARTAFSKLIEKGTLRRSVNPESKRALYGFFDQMFTADEAFSEDISFCKRWRDAGGEVWAIIDQDIGHVGSFTYRSKLIDALKP